MFSLSNYIAIRYSGQQCVPGYLYAKDQENRKASELHFPTYLPVVFESIQAFKAGNKAWTLVMTRAGDWNVALH